MRETIRKQTGISLFLPERLPSGFPENETNQPWIRLRKKYFYKNGQPGQAVKSYRTLLEKCDCPNGPGNWSRSGRNQRKSVKKRKLVLVLIALSGLQ